MLVPSFRQETAITNARKTARTPAVFIVSIYSSFLSISVNLSDLYL